MTKISVSLFSPRTTLILAYFLVTIAACSSRTHANPSNGIKASKSLVNLICSKTSNPPLCLQVLNSDPRTPRASLKDLGYISLDVTESQAKATQKLIGTLLQKANDPKLKVQYKACQGFSNESVIDLEQGRKALNSGDPRRLNNYASAALASADYCDEGFAGSNTPEPLQLKRANQKLKDLSSIILVVSVFLILPPSH